MPIELADIRLERIHKIKALERTAFVSHRVPGLEGDIVQDMGRASVRLQISGIFYGAEARADMETLREVYKAREPVDFLADIVGETYFAQVIVDRLDVVQAAHEPEQFSYVLTISEYVEPPAPPAPALEDVNAAILDEAQAFMDIADLPDVLSLPEFSDPTAPLGGVLDGVSASVSALGDAAAAMTELFGGS